MNRGKIFKGIKQQTTIQKGNITAEYQ